MSEIRGDRDWEGREASEVVAYLEQHQIYDRRRAESLARGNIEDIGLRVDQIEQLLTKSGNNQHVEFANRDRLLAVANRLSKKLETHTVKEQLSLEDEIAIQTIMNLAGSLTAVLFELLSPAQSPALDVEGYKQLWQTRNQAVQQTLDYVENYPFDRL